MASESLEHFEPAIQVLYLTPRRIKTDFVWAHSFPIIATIVAVSIFCTYAQRSQEKWSHKDVC
jgi:hypothetical protein